MGRGKAPTAKRDPYAEKLESMSALVDGMSGVCKPLAEDLLAAYVRVFRDYEALNRTLERDGLLIEVEKGAASNRHSECVKHPAFDMRRNTINQMADLANKIKRFVKDDEGVAEDEFDAFE